MYLKNIYNVNLAKEKGTLEKFRFLLDFKYFINPS